jgi:hypothetical protein
MTKLHNALSSTNFKHLTTLVLVFLVTSTTVAASFECPSDCECDENEYKAICNGLDGLVESNGQSNMMPIKSLTIRHKHFTSAMLKDLPKDLVHLNLRHNDITELPMEFMEFKLLQRLKLFGNPIECSCNTINVRDWLQSTQNVLLDDALCATPLAMKGTSWLDVEMNDTCVLFNTKTQESNEDWNSYENDEEMMGDEPEKDEIVYYSDEDKKEVAEENESDTTESKDVFSDESSTEKPEEKEVEIEEKPEEDETFDDDLIAVSQEPEPEEKDESSTVNKSEENYDEGSGDETTSVSSVVEDEAEESGSGILGILPGRNEDEGSAEEEIERKTVAPLGIGVHSGVIVVSEMPGEEKGNIKTASTDDNTGTYVLLGILGCCLAALIAFVAMKNRKETNRSQCYDVEKNEATELQDMDKSLLGKPADRNGNGSGKSKQTNNDDKPTPYIRIKLNPLKSVEEPPQEKSKSQHSLYENVPLTNGDGHVEPVHGTNGFSPISPDSDEEFFHPAETLNASPEVPKRYTPIYSPASPRSERYSPVYSPETGRVKIKLTEFQKPKTPLLVTKPRSRTGDHIITPN